MVLKEYNYTNDIGRLKKIVIHEPKEDIYTFDIWSRETGDYCGYGQKNKKEMNEFLSHYGLPTIE